jgi:hypothetical protein
VRSRSGQLEPDLRYPCCAERECPQHREWRMGLWRNIHQIKAANFTDD